MSSFSDDTPILIRTKLQRPRLGSDLISRPHLIDRLNQGLERKLTLLSAQAGSGKSTLLGQWLQEGHLPSAWLSLDEDDNSLMVFVSYFCAAIQTVFPEACKQALEFLTAPQAAPLRIITTSLVNELDTICRKSQPEGNKGPTAAGFIIALDDYHTITEPTIHELVSELIDYLPHCVHIVISTRKDPRLPLAGMRARKELTEVRTNDLLFTTEEAKALLEGTIGRELSDESVDLLTYITEGWAVGLRLAALTVRGLHSEKDFAEKLEGTDSTIIADYLVSEVLSQQSSEYHDFLLRSSVLRRFCSDLCDFVLGFEVNSVSELSYPRTSPSRTILAGLRSTNLFLLSLDQVGKWFRYHHLFRDLLNHRLHSKYDQKDIKDLHRRASRWFEENDLIDEAISHAFMADDLDLAAQIVARRRFRLMNHARWQRLARYLSLFPPAYASQQPDLLMLKAWLIYHRGHYDQLPPALEQIAAAMESTPLPPESTRYLKGESSALASLLSYYSIDASRTFAEADFSIRNTPPESWIVRSLARMFLAGSYQMRGELNHAYSAIFQAADEEIVQHNRFKSTMLMTSCFIYWIAGDLNGLIQVANRCMELFDYHHSVEIEGYVHYHLGCAYYQQNDLAAAQEHFAAVVHQPHLNYGDCYAHSAFGLSLTYLAQNRQELARKEAQSAFAYLLETGNMTLLPIAQAFEAELALRLGRLAEAEQWATQFDLLPPLLAMIQLYQYHFTFIKIWLALDTPASRQQAADLLYQLRHYTESTHNRIFLIEVLALLAVLHLNDGDEKAALAALERSVRLAQPGGVIRIFVDLGPPLAHLLDLLQQQDVAPEYVRRIRIAFPEAPLDRESAISTHRQPTSEILVDNLTPREQEVLELLAKRLTNKEIAEELVVSLGTVKTHTLSIYTKLNVHGRRQAVNRARELDLVSTN